MAKPTEKQTFITMIGSLSEKYPKAFSLDPVKIRPLKRHIIDDIVSDFGEECYLPLKRALAYYRHWPSYLLMLAYGKDKRDLTGARVEKTNLEERQKARNELIGLSLWNEHNQAIYEKRLTAIKQ